MSVASVLALVPSLEALHALLKNEGTAADAHSQLERARTAVEAAAEISDAVELRAARAAITRLTRALSPEAIERHRASEAQLREQVKSAGGLRRFVDEIVATARWGIGFSLVPFDEGEEPALGATRFGGYIDYRPEFADRVRTHVRNDRMFVGQLNLGDFDTTFTALKLPPAPGMLYIFSDVRQLFFDYDNAAAAGADGLVRATAADKELVGLCTLQMRRMDWGERLYLPGDGSALVFDALKGGQRDALVDTYVELLNALRDASGFDHTLGGHITHFLNGADVLSGIHDTADRNTLALELSPDSVMGVLRKDANAPYPFDDVKQFPGAERTYFLVAPLRELQTGVFTFEDPISRWD